jgi:uncharacterized protein YndB with AHSA1/START domain
MNWIERRKRYHRRRRILRALGLATLGVGTGWLAGAALPGVRNRSGEVTLASSRESIWRILTDVDGMPRWRSDVSSLERLPDLEGRPAWRERGSAGDRVILLAVVEPPTRLVMRRAGQVEERTIELAETPERTATVVRVTERTPIAPLWRVLARLVPGDRGAPRFLTDLERLVGGARGQVASRP